MRTEDGYIIHKCLNGEAEAFGLLVDKYRESIYALAYSKVHNFHDAEDITQEVFIKAFQKLGALRWWDNFMAWLYAITSNLCKDWIRARSRRPDREFVEDQAPGILRRPSMRSYRENLAIESLHEALDSLPEVYSQVLVLHYLGGMKVREIARFLGTSTSTIARRLRKARTQLKGEMLTMMGATFDEQALQIGFTFRIVEMVKRTAIQPDSRISRLSLGLSAVAAIILTFLSFSPRLFPLHHMVGMIGSPSANKTEVTDGIRAHLVELPKPAEQTIPVENLHMNMMPNLYASDVIKTPSIAPTAARVNRGLNIHLNIQDESILPGMVAQADIPRKVSLQRIASFMSVMASGAPAIGKGIVGGMAGTAGKTEGLSIAESPTAEAKDVNVRLVRRLGIGNVNSIAWSSDGEFLAAGTVTGVHLISRRTHGIQSFTEGSEDHVLSVAFSPDGSMIASGNGDNTIKLWAASSGECVATLRGHRGDVNSVAFSPDGLLIASASDDRTIKLWSDCRDTACRVSTLEGHKKGVKSVAFSPDGSVIASGGADNTVKLWSISTGKCVSTLKGHADEVGSVTFSPDGSMIASGSKNDSVKLWLVSNGQCIDTLGSNAMNSVAFSPDGLMVAFCSGETIRLWTPSGRKPISALGSHHGIINSIAFSPDGSVMASGGDDKTVRLRDLSRKADDNLIATLKWLPEENISILPSNLRGPEAANARAAIAAHKVGVTSIAFSPDGSLIASGSVDNTIKLWTVSDGKCIAILGGHGSDVVSVIFSPDGSMIASRSGDNTVKLWRTSNGECMATLAGPTSSAAFSPDGSILALGNASKPVRLWSVKDQEYIATIGKRSGSIAFSPDGSMIAAGDKLWSVPDGEYISSFNGGRYIAFSPDSLTIASNGPDGTIRLWSVLAGAHITTLKTGERWISALAFSPDGSMIASGSGRVPVKLWRLSDGECIATMEHGWWSATSIAFSPDGSMVASGSRDGAIKLWKAPEDEGTIAIGGHRGGVNSAALSPDGAIVASGGTDGTIRLWDTWDGRCVATLLGHDDGVNSVAISPDGSIIASGGGDKTIKLWSALDGEIVAALEGHEAGINSIAISPDGSMMASGSGDRTIRLWNMSDGKCVAILKGHRDISWSGVRGSVLSVAFSPDGSMIASASDDKTVRLWDVTDEECVAVLKGHKGYVHSVAFSPDGSLIASGSDDKTVKLWRASDGECISTLEGYGGSVGSVAFSPDGSLILSGDDDGSISLWSVSDGELTSLEGHSGQVRSIAFSQDGAAIVSGSEDGTIGLWEVEKP